MRKAPSAVLCSVLLLGACSDGSPTTATTTEPAPASTATQAPPASPAAAPSSPEAQAYLDAVQDRDAVAARLGTVLGEDTLDLTAFQAAGTEYATAVEAFDRALAATAWPPDVQPLVDRLRAANVAEVKAARLMESALDETTARLATSTLREARRRGAVHDTAIRVRLGLPAAG